MICLRAASFIIAILGGTAAIAAFDRKPNLILILADDLGYGDVGCFGSADTPTPHLDRLAQQGARLTSWYAQPVCTPSRYAMLTGRHPNRTRGALMIPLMRAEGQDDDKGLNRDETTLADLLQKTGYGTSLIGKWHLGHGRSEFFPTQHGFDAFFGHTGGCVDFFTLKYGNIPDWYRDETLDGTVGYATDVVTDEAVRFLRKQEAQSPFFLYLAYAAPHYAKGWNAAEGTLTDELQAKPESIARFREVADPRRRTFIAMVSELDAAVGRVLDVLDEVGLTENTWVVFASDNGGDLDFGGCNAPLAGEKNTLWEGGVRTPCIMRYPGRIAAGTEISQPITVQDLLPTFCKTVDLDLAGLSLDGLDMRSALFERRRIERDIFFARHGASSLRRGDWKYLHIDGRERLFNLANDLGEQHDLADTHPAKLTELKAAHRAAAAELP